MHMVNLSSIPGISYALQEPSGIIPECRGMSNPQVLLGVAPNQKQNKRTGAREELLGADTLQALA